MCGQNPIVTIIVATYNSEKTLDKCIQSVINQTYKYYELIIIDGASNDGTINIIKKNESNITKWISEKDEGIYDAWNKALKIATGEWITFIGSDDEFYPDALGQYINFIQSLNNPNIEFVSSRMDLVDELGEYVKTTGLSWDWQICRRKNTIAHPGSLHKKTLFDKYGLFDTQYKICGDYEFLLRPAQNMQAAFLPKVTVKMAQGGVSFNVNKLFKEHYRAARSTGKLNYFIAGYYYIWHLGKNYIKIPLRKLGIKA